MRKYLGIGLILLTALAAIAGVGVIAAQDTEDTEDTTEARTWLGVALIEQDETVVIARVQTGSPANAADLLIGDVISSFNGEAVTSAEQLIELVTAAAPGDTVTVEVVRNGETVSIDVTLGSFVAMGRRGGLLSAEPLTWAERFLRADLEEADGGYTVTEVAEEAPFALEAGDLVTAVNDLSVIDLDLQALHDNLAAMDEPALTLTVTRAGESVTLEGDLTFGRFGMGMMERGLGRGGFGGRGDFGPGGRGRGGFGRPGYPGVPGSADPSDGQLYTPTLPDGSEI